jgi:preprotein translocase subunit YajC
MLLEIFAQNGNGGFNLLGLLPFILIFVVIWFFMMRPQAKKQKETQKMLSELKPHDIVVVKIGKDIKIEVKKSAIASKTELGKHTK